MASIFQVVQRLATQKPNDAAVDAALRNVEFSAGVPACLSYRQLFDYSVDVARGLQEVLRLGGGSGRPTVGTCMRRGNEFYVTFLAASYCHFPIAAMSTDHPDQASQAKRNQQILSELRPAILVCDATVRQEFAAVTHINFQDLLVQGRSHAPFYPAPADETAVLCYQYTGGTTGQSRCCAATHAMALWEISKYPEVVRLEKGRVLQQHSVYWMASMAGEIDIALSFGSALVFCEARSSEDVAKIIKEHEISCAGLVPSILAELDPRSVPSLKVVFTWGEALQTRTAVQWAKEVHLIDLLIASEYWLTLFADWTEWSQSSSRVGSRPAFRAVSGAAVRLRPEAGSDPGQGELLVSGRQVTPGYFNDRERQQQCFLEGWYRTSDCLEQVSGGYKFAGRADDMAKVGGVWVDTRQLCDSLREVEGVSEACMYSKAAFVSLTRVGAATLKMLRRKLPADHALFVVPRMPRNDVTGKVDRRKLDAMTGRGLQAGLGSNLEERQEQLTKVYEFSRWYWLLLLLLTRPVFDLVASTWEEDFFLAFLQDTLLVLLRLWLMTYLFLSYMYREKALSNYCQYCPFHFVGLFTAAAGVLPLLVLAILSAEGMWQAYRRGRWWVWPGAALLSYPKWAQQDSEWWVAESTKWRDIPAWYTRRLVLKLPIETQFRLGYARKCHTCKQIRIRGRVNPNVDPNWYCEACWKHYDAHWKCSRCPKWVTRGKKQSGRWICLACFQKTQEESAESAAITPSTASTSAPPLATPLAAEEPAVKRQRVDDQWVRGYAGAASANEVARSLSCSRSGPAGSSPSPARPSSVPADRRQSGRSSGPRLDSRSPRRSAAAERWPNRDGQGNSLDVKLQGDMLEEVEDEEMAPSMVEKSHLWRLVEEVTDFRFGAESDRVALDSMRWQRLTSRLRRQEGRNLPWDAQRRCGTLGELLREIESLPVVQGCAVQPREMEEVAGWFMMWGSKCLWKINIQRHVSEAALRYALEELMWRHSTLRVRRADDEMLFKHFQHVLSIVQLFWLWLMDKSGFVCRILRRLLSVFADHLDRAWPRVRFEPAEVNNVLTIHPPCKSKDAALEHIASATHPQVWTFVPPFQAMLVPYGSSNGLTDGAVLLLVVSHMISDGASVVPLMADLATLLSNAEGHATGALLRPLPPVDSALKVLRSRISRTAQGDHSLSDAVTPTQLDHSSSADTILHQCWDFNPELVRILKQAALRLAVPDEILLLTAIGVSIAKLHDKAMQTIQMVIPGRDGPQDSDLVGLFAEYRRLEIRTEGLSYLGAALSLHYIVKERLWRQPPSVGQSKAPFVNFEWTDFEERQGLSQIPEPRRKDFNVHSPMNVVVTSPTRDSWRLLLACRGDRYTGDDQLRMKGYLQEALRCLIEDPLAMTSRELVK